MLFLNLIFTYFYFYFKPTIKSIKLNCKNWVIFKTESYSMISFSVFFFFFFFFFLENSQKKSKSRRIKINGHEFGHTQSIRWIR
jgi:hypothetical protein